jgi:hypothetical protein
MIKKIAQKIQTTDIAIKDIDEIYVANEPIKVLKAFKILNK